jgi:hypothetical protein
MWKGNGYVAFERVRVLSVGVRKVIRICAKIGPAIDHDTFSYRPGSIHFPCRNIKGQFRSRNSIALMPLFQHVTFRGTGAFQKSHPVRRYLARILLIENPTLEWKSLFIGKSVAAWLKMRDRLLIFNLVALTKTNGSGNAVPISTSKKGQMK